MSLPGAAALAATVQQGELPPARVVELALAGTDLLLGAEGIGTFLHVDAAQARVDAAHVAARLAAGEAPPLAAAPLAVSDDIAQEGQPWGAGSVHRRHLRATSTAPALQRLRDGGAIVIGRTNMDALGLGATTEDSGYHSTINPWDPFRAAGGAAGGAAAAVAQGAAALGLAVDRVGDALQPAACCGAVALRPTWGAVERDGLLAVAPTLETAAPLGRTVRDVALATELLLPGRGAAEACGAAVAERTVGLVLEAQGRGVEAPLKARLSAGVAALEEAGVRVRPASVPLLRHAPRAAHLLLAAEAARHLDLPPDSAPEAGVLHHLALGRHLLGPGGELLGRARSLRARLRASLLELLGPVDALVLPAMPTVAPHFAEGPVERLHTQAFVAAAALAGLPALVVSVGLADLGLGIKMPAGLLLVGRPDDEAGLLALGAAVEASLGSLPPPPRLRL